MGLIANIREFTEQAKAAQQAADNVKTSADGLSGLNAQLAQLAANLQAAADGTRAVNDMTAKSRRGDTAANSTLDQLKTLIKRIQADELAQ